MFGADKKYLAVLINDGIIKVAQGSTSGSVERVARGSYAAASADEAAKSLRSLLGPFNRKAPVLCLVPASAATTKIIEVPSSDPEEIKSIINLQASRYTPYSREEVLISYINLGLNASNNTRLVLAIVHRDFVKEKIGILEKSGLEVDSILFVPEAEARFYAKAVNLKKDGNITGVLDFSLNATTYIVVSKGALLFVRHIPIGIKALVEGADSAAKVQEEIKKSMDAFLQEDGREAPNAYIVSAASEAVKNILPVLKEGLGVDFQVNSFLSFIKPSGDVRRKLQGDFGDDSFLDVVAPVTTANRCEVNLMPDEMVNKKALEKQKNEGIMTGVAALAIMVLIGIMLIGNIYFKDTFLTKNLRQQYAPQMQEVVDLQAKMGKIKVVRDYIKSRMSSLDVIHDLSVITPNTIYLSNINVDEDGTVTIDGIADDMSLVYSYVKNIGDSDKFKEAKLKSTATKKTDVKEVAAFEIEFKESA